MKRLRMGLLGACAALALAACDVGGSYTLEEHMDRANEARMEGNLRAAIVELKNALREHPDAGAARFMLGQLYIDLEDGFAAEKELMLARDLNVDARSTVLPLARAWILQREFQKVLDEIPVSPHLPAREQAELRVVRGDASRGLGDLEAAQSDYEIATKLQADNALGYVGLANVALARSDIETAKKHAAEAVKLDSNNLKVITLQGDIASAQNDYKSAAGYYAQLVKARPENVFYRTVLSWSLLNLGDNDGALKEVTKVLNVVPDYPPANHIRALLALQAKDYQEAANYAERALNADPNRIPTLLVQGVAAFSLGQLEKAYASVTRYLSAVPGNVQARKLLGNIQLALGRADEAVETLGKLDGKAAADPELLNLMAQAAIQSGDMEAGRAYLERAAEASPDAAGTLTRLGQTNIALGNVEEGLKELEKAVQQEQKAMTPRIVLVMEYMRAGKFDEAIAGARQIQKDAPKYGVGYTLEGLAFGAQGKLKEAQALLEKSLKVEPGNLNATYNLVRIYTRENNFDAVKRVLDEALKHNKNDQTAMLMQADLARMQNNQAVRMDWLNKAVAAHPEAREPAYLLAQAHMEAGDPLKALNATQKIRPIYASDPALLSLIGSAEMASRQFANAITTYEQLVRAAPEVAESHFLLATALMAQGNAERADSAISKALELNANHAPAKLMAARIAVTTGKFDKAGTIIEGLLKERPAGINIADVYELKGILAFGINKPDEAVNAFAEAHKVVNTGYSLQKLAEAQTLTGKADDAIATYKDWLARNSGDLGSRFNLATLYLTTGRYADAVREYEVILGKEKNNAVTLNNYSWALFKNGQFDKALANINRAIELDPNAAPFHDTAGQIYDGLKRPRDAVAAYRKAVDLDANNADVRLRYANALVAIDRKEEARQVLNDLLLGDFQLADRKGVEKLILNLSSE